MSLQVYKELDMRPNVWSRLFKIVLKAVDKRKHQSWLTCHGREVLAFLDEA